MIKILLSTRLGERRWTQAELARRTEIRLATINEYYHDLAERIDLEHLDLICKALDCQPGELIVRAADAPSRSAAARPRTAARLVPRNASNRAAPQEAQGLNALNLLARYSVFLPPVSPSRSIFSEMAIRIYWLTLMPWRLAIS